MYTVELIDQMAEVGISEKRTKRWLSDYSSRTGESYERHVTDDVAAIILSLPDIIKMHKGVTISEALDIATGQYVPSISPDGSKEILREVKSLHRNMDILIQAMTERTRDSEHSRWQEAISTTLAGLDGQVTDITPRTAHQTDQVRDLMIGESAEDDLQ